jgi:hypothetical protein
VHVVVAIPALEGACVGVFVGEETPCCDIRNKDGSHVAHSICNVTEGAYTMPFVYLHPHQQLHYECAQCIWLHLAAFGCPITLHVCGTRLASRTLGSGAKLDIVHSLAAERGAVMSGSSNSRPQLSGS